MSASQAVVVLVEVARRRGRRHEMGVHIVELDLQRPTIGVRAGLTNRAREPSRDSIAPHASPAPAARDAYIQILNAPMVDIRKNQLTNGKKERYRHRFDVQMQIEAKR